MAAAVLGVAVSAAAATASASSPAATGNSATPPTLTVRLIKGSQAAAPDAGPIPVDVRVGVDADCRRGCDLVANREIDGGVDHVIDTRTFAPGTTHYYTVRTLASQTTNYYYTSDLFRLVQHTGAGDRVLVTAEEFAHTTEEPGPGDFRPVTATGDWRRDLDFGATETMIVRSTKPGSSLSYKEVGLTNTDGGQVGVLAETGPNGGVLGVYVGGSLAAKVDLRAPKATERAVVALLDVTHRSAAVRLVNMTPPSRSGAVVSFDGFLLNESWKRPPRAIREIWAPIHIDIADQQLTSPVSSARVKMRVSATVSECSAGCSLRWGTTTIASTTATGTTTIRATIAPTFDWKSGESSQVALYRGSNYVGFAYVFPFWGDSDSTYSHGVTVERRPGAIFATAQVMRTPGVGVTTQRVFIDPEAKRTVGVLAERGPGMGVLGVYRDAVLVKTVDLRAARRAARSIVASVELGSSGRITLANITRPGRADRMVVVDDLVAIGFDNDRTSGRPTR